MQFDYDDWAIPPIEMTEEKIKDFPNLQNSMGFADEPEHIMCISAPSDESTKLKEFFDAAYRGQRYMTYDDNLYSLSWPIQHERPE